MNVNTEENKLVQDLKRTIILGSYIREWGLPDYRIISSKEDSLIEIYSFPPLPNNKVWRIASIGMSNVAKSIGQLIDFELFMTLPSDLGGVKFQEVANFIMDVFAHSLKPSVIFDAGKTIEETILMPSKWMPRAVLLDEPLGEKAELETFLVGLQKIRLLWVVPIYGIEQRLIVESGIEAFDKLQEKSEFSLVDVERPCLL
jgi:hypothetical protein